MTFCLNPRFVYFIHHIYSQRTWDKGQYRHYEVNLISWPSLTDQLKRKHMTKLYNKRDDFSFRINFPSICVNIPSLSAYWVAYHNSVYVVPELGRNYENCLYRTESYTPATGTELYCYKTTLTTKVLLLSCILNLWIVQSANWDLICSLCHTVFIYFCTYKDLYGWNNNESFMELYIIAQPLLDKTFFSQLTNKRTFGYNAAEILTLLLTS